MCDDHGCSRYTHYNLVSSADSRLSTVARQFIDVAASRSGEIGISSITLVEMIYLIEKGKILPQHFSSLAEELSDSDSLFIEIPVDLRIVRALSRIDGRQIPDMPDRNYCSYSNEAQCANHQP